MGHCGFRQVGGGKPAVRQVLWAQVDEGRPGGGTHVQFSGGGPLSDPSPPPSLCHTGPNPSRRNYHNVKLQLTNKCSVDFSGDGWATLTYTTEPVHSQRHCLKAVIGLTPHKISSQHQGTVPKVQSRRSNLKEAARGFTMRLTIFLQIEMLACGGRIWQKGLLAFREALH